MVDGERDPLEIARARKASAFRIFIYCDDSSHARKVAVTNFIATPSWGIATPSGGWAEQPASRASMQGPVGAGRTILDDELAQPGWANAPSEHDQDIRERFEPECRKCHRRVVARKDNLFRVLGAFQLAGVSRVALSVLGASLSRQSSN